MSEQRDDGDADRLRVIMPVHNASAFVGEALDSVLRDLPDRAHVVVVDDGSTDGSAAIVQASADQDPRVRIIRNETPIGVSRALNAGIEAAGCPPFVAVAEHDDLVLPGRFAAHLAALEADERLGAVSSEGRYLGPTGRIGGRVAVGPTSRAEFERLRDQGREILIPHPAITYRREAVVGARGYDPAFDSAQDLDIVNRLVYEHGWEVRLLPGPHVLYRIHGGSMSFTHIAAQRLMTRYIVYRNAVQLRGEEARPFAAWRADNEPNRRTRWRWYRKDTGALHYRRAGLAWLNRRPVAMVGHLIAASALHPRWVVQKLRVFSGR